MLRLRPIGSFTIISLALVGSLSAAVSQEEAARLDNELTPLGAIRAGNEAGTIPEWTGGITEPPAGYSRGDYHPDPYADDEMLFEITADNVDEYAENLSPGQLQMFKRYPNSWKMKVYPTRRSASFPQYVYDAIVNNATTAELTEAGNGVRNAVVSSPFPIPQNGLECVWNHLLRYRGNTIARVIAQAAPTTSGTYTLVKIKEDIFIPYNQEGVSVADLDNRLAYFMQEVTEPAFLAGQILLVHDTLDQVAEPRQAWVYNPGQRRVRRAPNIAFDNPGTASDGQRTTDQFDMFNGSPERYEWELVGRKEMYIPYNNYALHSDGVSYDDILKQGHMNPDLVRYELHRVWVVDARLKSGTSHIYARRTFFIDEDSWQISVADQYDSRGSIWRVSEAYVINYYETPQLWDTVLAHYDLLNGRYLVIGMNNKDKLEDFEVNLSKGDFTPSQLRRKGRR